MKKLESLYLRHLTNSTKMRFFESSKDLNLYFFLLTFPASFFGGWIWCRLSVLSSSSSNKLRTVFVLVFVPLSKGDDEENKSELTGS